MKWKKPETFGILNSNLSDNTTEHLKSWNFDEQHPYSQVSHNTNSVLGSSHYCTSSETDDDGPGKKWWKNRFATVNKHLLEP